VNHITIEGILYSNNNSLTVTGNYTVNGDHVGTGQTILTGTGTLVTGTGTIHAGDLRFEAGNKIIPSNAYLTKAFGRLRIKDGITVTNNGTMIIGGNLDSDSSTGTWVNASGSVLNVRQEVLVGLGILDATASNNTVRYYGSDTQTVKPSLAGYYDLILEGGVKMMTGGITVGNDITIAATLDCNNYTISLKGDWNCSKGSFEEQAGAVWLTGSSDQYISNMAGETFYDLNLSKTGGDLYLNDSVWIANTLQMSTGDINAEAGCLIIGISPSQEGTLSWSSGFVYGPMKRYANAAAFNYLFPLGFKSFSRAADIYFSSLSPGAVSVEFIASTPGSNGLPLWDATDSLHNLFAEGYWEVIGTDSLATNLFDLKLNGNGFSTFTIDSSTRIVHRPDAMSNWALEGSHLDGLAPVVQRSGITQLGHFGFADTSACLSPATSTITGSDSVCISVTGQTYSVTNTAGSSYLWTVSGGAITAGQGTNSITVDWGASGMEGSVSVTETNSCGGGDLIDTVIEIHPLPTADIVGKANVSDFTTGEPYFVTPRAGYTYTWDIIGGSVASGAGTSSITVDWGAAGIGAVKVVGSNGCGSADSVSLSINIYVPINSTASGAWHDLNTWNCKCVPQAGNNVRIMPTHNVYLDSSRTINHFEVTAGGIFDDNSNSFEVTGDLTVDGEYTGRDSLTLSGSGAIIDGVGDFTHTGDIYIDGGGKDILTTTFLSKSTGDMIITDVYVVTNYGNFELGEDLVGTKNNSRWVQEPSADLKIGGSLLNTGRLFADALNNRVEYNGAATQTVKDPELNEYSVLAINKTGGVANLSANTKALGLELMLGNLRLGTNNIQMLDNSTISGGGPTSYVQADGAGVFVNEIDGPGNYFFPVGDNNEYSPLTATINSAVMNGNAYFWVNVVDAMHPANTTSDYITRYWKVHSQYFMSIDYDMSYDYQDADIVGDESKMRAALYDGGGWTYYDTAATAPNTLYTSTGITNPPSNYAFTGGSGSVLPIELLEFYAKVNKGNVDLTWVTATEINNSHFELERSRDGLSFEKFASVNGSGTSFYPVGYSSTDFNPYTGISYYRLRQVDLDGTSTVSDPIAVEISAPESGFSLYPNPLVGNEAFTLFLGEWAADKDIQVQLYDAIGATHYARAHQVNSKGKITDISFDKGLVPGIYYIRVGSGASAQTAQKLLILPPR
jgi:hypothetical protein